MKFKSLVFLTLLVMTTSASAANLWTARGVCFEGACDGSVLPPGLEFEFNLFLDDSTLAAPPGAFFVDPSLMLAFQVIIDPDAALAPPGTFPEFLSIGTEGFFFQTPVSPGDIFQGLSLVGTDGAFCSSTFIGVPCLDPGAAPVDPAGWGAIAGGVPFGGTGTVFPWLDWQNTGYVENIPQVPIPAAAWLFGSALLGLIGVARRRKV